MIDGYTYRMILQLLQTEAKVSYIMTVTGASVKDILSIAAENTVALEPSIHEQYDNASQSSTKITDPRVPVPSRLIRNPAYRPFPKLEGLDDSQRIVALTLHGLAAPKIRKHLSQPFSVRQIHVVARRHLGRSVREVNNSRDNQLGVYMADILSQIMEDAFGKDRYVCELCLEPQPEGCIIHHTKYAGATAYDLMFICQSCNRSRANVGLT